VVHRIWVLFDGLKMHQTYTPEGIKEAPKFIDKYISTEIPTEDELMCAVVTGFAIINVDFSFRGNAEIWSFENGRPSCLHKTDIKSSQFMSFALRVRNQVMGPLAFIIDSKSSLAAFQ
jgi:hypothetical protein